MDIILWILQGLLGFMFIGSGGLKAVQPPQKLNPQMGKWISVYQPWWIRTIGVLEVAGGAGRSLAPAFKIVPARSASPGASRGRVLHRRMGGTICPAPQVMSNLRAWRTSPRIWWASSGGWCIMWLILVGLLFKSLQVS
jgi:hypothetical protein